MPLKHSRVPGSWRLWIHISQDNTYCWDSSHSVLLGIQFEIHWLDARSGGRMHFKTLQQFYCLLHIQPAWRYLEYPSQNTCRSQISWLVKITLKCRFWCSAEGSGSEKCSDLNLYLCLDSMHPSFTTCLFTFSSLIFLFINIRIVSFHHFCPLFFVSFILFCATFEMCLINFSIISLIN